MNPRELPRRVAQATSGGELTPQPAVLGLVRSALRAGRRKEATEHIRRAVAPTLDHATALALGRLYARARSASPDEAREPRVALLGSHTTEPTAELLQLFALPHGLDLQIYQAPFGTYRQEILDERSELHAFRPRFVLLSPSWRDLEHRPDPDASSMQATRVREREIRSWKRLWETLHERLGCVVIQDGFVRPAWSSFANLELGHPASLGSTIQRLNLALADAAPPYVLLHDVDQLAACHGRWKWSDPRYDYAAKLPCAPELLVDYAHSLASLLGALTGSSKKCLVLDLDNTLWGGVVGDDGAGSLRIGAGDAEGEAFADFQRYVLQLKARGVVLAVCSANDESIARAAFAERPEMPLGLDDFACFVANWQDKASNLRRISDSLDLGLDSLVFVDDDPAQRALVRRILPEVSVPELPSDPAHYVRALERERYFQVASVGREDFGRAASYRANTRRKDLQTSAGSLQEFLDSLEMSATIVPIGPPQLERCAQLINRSNQFNLTTIRRTTAELEGLLRDERWLTYAMSLSDRFGDSGIISTVLARVDGEHLELDTWVMSCRVLRRGAERFLFNHLVSEARARGLRAIRGRYVPTPKNRLVEQHYAQLGFECIYTAPDGSSDWSFSVKARHRPLQTSIHTAALDE